MKQRLKSFVIHSDIVFREEEEGAFLFNPKTDVLRCVNQVGAFICRYCNGKNNLDDICRGLIEEYEVDVSEEILKNDIQTFLEKLIGLNLIEERG